MDGNLCATGPIGTSGILTGSAKPSQPEIHNFIRYVDVGAINALAPDYTSAQIPPEMPFIASYGTVAVYVKPDAGVLKIDPIDPLKVAFALEDAGIPRTDITTYRGRNAFMYVRLHPITVPRIQQIITAARRVPGQDSFMEIHLFVKDCDAAIAAASGIAVRIAERRARAMARGAGARLRELLAVADVQGEVTDANCGLDSSDSIQALAEAAMPARKVRGLRFTQRSCER